MKIVRTLALAAIACGLAMLGACSSQITPDQLKQALNNVATVTQAGCTVVQPTLAAGATATANPVAGVAAGVNGVFCAAQAPLVAATAPSTPVPASAPAAASAPK